MKLVGICGMYKHAILLGVMLCSGMGVNSSSYANDIPITEISYPASVDQNLSIPGKYFTFRTLQETHDLLREVGRADWYTLCNTEVTETKADGTVVVTRKPDNACIQTMAYAKSFNDLSQVQLQQVELERLKVRKSGIVQSIFATVGAGLVFGGFSNTTFSLGK